MFGIETEYGLQIEGRSVYEQIEDAAAFVDCCPIDAFLNWDYSAETPRNDLRGYSVRALAVDPQDAEIDIKSGRKSDLSNHANHVLINGARFYNDHGHPEYATPECSRILDLLAHDLAGEQILKSTSKLFNQKYNQNAIVYKNNSDFHGSSYGTHENYLFPRKVPVNDLISNLIPFLVVRQVLFGAGKVGSEDGQQCNFQLSQRADFINELASVDTLYRRPLFNTRDEPHKDPKEFVRVHVITGDANRMQWATAMKIGATQLVLNLIQKGVAPKWDFLNPVSTFKEISKDQTFEWSVKLRNGSYVSALEVLQTYRDSFRKYLQNENSETNWIISEFHNGIEALTHDKKSFANRIDWIAKQSLCQNYVGDTQEWDTNHLQSIDLAYSEITGDDNLFSYLTENGMALEIIPQQRVEDAHTTPPPTRAKHRSQLVQHHRHELSKIGWERATFIDGTSVLIRELDVE